MTNEEHHQHFPLTNENIDFIVSSLKEYAVLTTNEERRILTWNTGAKAVFGYEESEIINEFIDRLFTPEDRLTRQPETETEVALRTGKSYDDRWHLRKDGSRFFAKGIMIHLKRVGKPPLFIKIAVDWTEKKKRRKRLLKPTAIKMNFWLRSRMN